MSKGNCVAWTFGDPLDPEILAPPAVGSLDDAWWARTAGLLQPLLLPLAQQQVVEALVEHAAPWHGVLMWAHLHMPGAVLAGVCQEMVRRDRDALVFHANSINLVYRLASRIVDDLAAAHPAAVEHSLGRLHALHALLEAGVKPGEVDNEDRHCLGKIASTWLYPPLDQANEVPFSQPGSHGALCGLVNLLVAYGTSLKTPLSDPTGRVCSADTLLAEDEDLGPMLVWGKREFEQGLLDARTQAATTPTSRPRL